MTPPHMTQAMWLARGEALGNLLRFLQRALLASARRLRNNGLAHRFREIGLARRRLG
jgi:hypothetical protein